MSNGWICLHRTIKSHWIWDRPDYLQAWIAVLMTVNHSPAKVLIKSKLYEVGAGESVRSLSSWAKELGKGWTKDKVRTFFKLLESDHMITMEGDRNTTRLTVCKWDTYQNQSHTDPTHVPHTSHTRPTHVPHTSTQTTMKTRNNNDQQRQQMSASAQSFMDDDDVEVINGTLKTSPHRSFQDWRLSIGKRCFVRDDNREDWNHLWELACKDTPDGSYDSKVTWDLFTDIYQDLVKNLDQGKSVFVNQFIEQVNLVHTNA